MHDIVVMHLEIPIAPNSPCDIAFLLIIYLKQIFKDSNQKNGVKLHNTLVVLI
jgi:hypothetical protein